MEKRTLKIHPRKKIPCLLFVHFVSLASTLSEQPAPFIDVEGFDFLSLVPDPPEDESLAGRADLEIVLQLQLERIARQNTVSFASPILGDTFNAETLPTTAAFFTKSHNKATRSRNAPKPTGHEPGRIGAMTE